MLTDSSVRTGQEGNWIRYMNTQPWMVSLHGGHSSEFCDHATGTLRELLEAAVARGLHTYGVAEHAPRYEERHLYPEEIEMGWDIAKLVADFEAYAAATEALAREYEGRLTVLRGFEAEVVPAGRYADVMLGLRDTYSFDYMVGSVHYVNDFLFDYSAEAFSEAVAREGGLEHLAVRYYEAVAEMVAAMNPEVVAHIDVIRKYAAPHGRVDTPAIRDAAIAALDVVRTHDAILDVNTGAYRRGDTTPYPAPWLIEAAHSKDISFCLGDDSHAPDQVGAHFEKARDYLLEQQVHTITTLARSDTTIVRKKVPLG
jgi:histidinol-phosphatase (PHP family)